MALRIPQPRGVPQIEVSFDIDANGILNVSARDKGQVKSRRSPSRHLPSLPREEVDRLVEELRDTRKKTGSNGRELRRRTNWTSLIYSVEKSSKTSATDIFR